jgi:hypothetical protein
MPVTAESGPPLATIPVVMDVDEACELARRGGLKSTALLNLALSLCKSGRRRLIPGVGFRPGWPMECLWRSSPIKGWPPG